MWTIILTIILVTGNNGSSRPSVTTVTIGQYKTAAACMQYANSLTKIEVLRANTRLLKDTSAICVKID